MDTPALEPPGGGLARLAPEGELGIYTVAALREAWLQALATHEALEIDLGRIDEIDTAGLQLMLMAKRSAGRSVRFVNHSAAVLRLLDLARLGGALGDPLLEDATPATQEAR